MKKPKTPKTPKKKLPKYEGGGNAGKELKNTGLFLADTILAEWAPNAIKQDQYGDTKWGKNLGNVAAVHESFSSQSPISKNVSKMWNDGKTGYTEEQMKLYSQVQPIAKAGSKIGEMWTGSALGGVGMGGGAGASGAAAGTSSGASGQMLGQMVQQNAGQFLNTQYDPMANMQDPTGNDAIGMRKNNPYYANGGITQPNAELEKQENFVSDNGKFIQFDGPTHEQGGIPTNLPEGKVFSDRLRMPKTGKTFAQLNKPNNTNKEDKILEDTNSNSVAKATASLMKLAKQKSSDELFNAQEALKQSKIDKYTMRLGGTVKYPDGGKTKSNKMVLSNNDIDQITRYLYSQKDSDEAGSQEYWKMQNYMQTLPEVDRSRIYSLYNSPQFNKLMEIEAGPNINFLMPNKYGKYVDSGVNPFDAILPTLTKGVAKVSNSIKDIIKDKKSKDFSDLRKYAKETADFNKNNPSPYNTDIRGIPTKEAEKLKKIKDAQFIKDNPSKTDDGLPIIPFDKKTYDYLNNNLKDYLKNNPIKTNPYPGRDFSTYLKSSTIPTKGVSGPIIENPPVLANGGKLPKYGYGNITGTNSVGMQQTNPYYTANIDEQNKLAMQQGTEVQMNAMSDQVIQKIPGFGQYYQFAKGASDMGRSMIGKDEQGYAHSNVEQAADNFMNPTHQAITANASKGQHGEAVMSAFINPALGSLAGEVFKGTGFGDKATAYGRGEKIFSNGGAIESAWANAEVEKQENAITPNGQFVQYNGPSHEQGGIPTRLPEGTNVFSDRLKMPGTSKTFAELNKPNNTTKEDKILEDARSNSVAKAAASLMKLAKQKSSNKLFNAQKSLKQSKIDSYTKKLGGTVKYPDGGPVVNKNIPNYNYPSSTDQFLNKGYINPSTAAIYNSPNYIPRQGTEMNSPKYMVNLNEVGMGNPQRTVNLPAFGESGTGYIIQPNTMTDAEFIALQQARLGLPKQAYGGKFEHGGNQRLKMMESEEPELLHPREFGYANYKDWGDLNRAEFGDTRPKAPTSQPNQGMDWGNIATQAGLGLMNNLGNIYDLARANKVETDKYDRMNPKLLDPTASLRDVDMQRKIAEYNIRNSSVGHSGAYLGNRTGSDVSLALAKDKIQREYQNANAGILNASQQYNIEQHKAEDIANMQNRAQSRNIKANAISKIGQNTVGQYKDTQMTKADMDKIELIKTMYPAIKNNKEMMAYYKTKYPNFNWSEIETNGK